MEMNITTPRPILRKLREAGFPEPTPIQLTNFIGAERRRRLGIKYCKSKGEPLHEENISGGSHLGTNFILVCFSVQPGDSNSLGVPTRKKRGRPRLQRPARARVTSQNDRDVTVTDDTTAASDSISVGVVISEPEHVEIPSHPHVVLEFPKWEPD